MSVRGERLSGQVVATYGRRLLVAAPDAELVACVPRGKHAAHACGDRVLVARTGRGEGVIESADARATLFLRAAPHRRKLIAANATQVAVIVAGEPSTSDEIVCRILVAAAQQAMRTLIVLNKTDLETPTAGMRARLAPFARAGYAIVEISAQRDVQALRERLAAETTVLIGQSGMGKSTIVNALVPAAGAATREISRFLDSGRHTTSATRLYRLDERTRDHRFARGRGVRARTSRGGGNRSAVSASSRHSRADAGSAIAATAPSQVARYSRQSSPVQVAARRLELLHRIQDAEAAVR